MPTPNGGPRVPGPGKRLGRPPTAGERRSKVLQIPLTPTERAAVDRAWPGKGVHGRIQIASRRECRRILDDATESA